METSKEIKEKQLAQIYSPLLRQLMQYFGKTKSRRPTILV